MTLPLVSVFEYGKEIYHAPQVLLNCPHDGEWNYILQMIPEVSEIFEDSLEVLQSYAALERDVGSFDVTIALAEFLHEPQRLFDVAEVVEVLQSHKIFENNTLLQQKFRITVLRVNFSRALIDMNRQKQWAIRHIFHKEKHPVILHQLHQIYDQTNMCIDQQFQKLAPTGIWMDMHTMASDTPKNLHQEHFGNVQEYVDSYICPEYQGQARAFNLLTTEIQEGICFAEKNMIRSVQQLCHIFDIECTADIPFPLYKSYMSTLRLQQYAGLAIDIPKHMLTSFSRADTRKNLPHLRIQKEKVQRFAAVLALAILPCLEKRFMK